MTNTTIKIIFEISKRCCIFAKILNKKQKGNNDIINKNINLI